MTPHVKFIDEVDIDPISEIIQYRRTLNSSKIDPDWLPEFPNHPETMSNTSSNKAEMLKPSFSHPNQEKSQTIPKYNYLNPNKRIILIKRNRIQNMIGDRNSDARSLKQTSEYQESETDYKLEYESDTEYDEAQVKMESIVKVENWMIKTEFQLKEEIEEVDTKIDFCRSPRCRDTSSDITEPYYPSSHTDLEMMGDPNSSNCSIKTESFEPRGCVGNRENTGNICPWHAHGLECPFCDSDSD